MRKAILLPGIAVLGGIAALAVRHIQQATAFEVGTGLPIVGAPATYGMWAVGIAVAVVVIAMSLGQHQSFQGRYDRAFHTTGFASLLCKVAAGFLFAVGGVLNILAYQNSPLTYTGTKEVGIIRVIVGVVCLLTAVGVFWVARADRTRGQPGNWLLLPGFLSCVWLMSNYQVWAKNPVLEDYVFALCAVLLTMLANYFVAGFLFGRARVSATLITSLLAVAFSISALGDGLPLYDLILYAGHILYLLPLAVTLLVNDRPGLAPEVPEAPDYDAEKEDLT